MGTDNLIIQLTSWVPHKRSNCLGQENRRCCKFLKQQTLPLPAFLTAILSVGTEGDLKEFLYYTVDSM